KHSLGMHITDHGKYCFFQIKQALGMEALKKFNEQLRSRKAPQPKALLIVNQYVFSFLKKKKPIETFYIYWHSCYEVIYFSFLRLISHSFNLASASFNLSCASFNLPSASMLLSSAIFSPPFKGLIKQLPRLIN
ncbi:MAG: hypothetical protein ACXVDT_16395, partial [Bacteroidia bacterium]